MPTILSLVCLPSFAGAPVSVANGASERDGPYLVIIQDKMENSSERFERSEDIRRVPDPAEEKFGRGERSRLPTRFALMQDRVPLDALIGAEHFRYVTRTGGTRRCLMERSDTATTEITVFTYCQTPNLAGLRKWKERENIARFSPHRRHHVPDRVSFPPKPQDLSAEATF